MALGQPTQLQQIGTAIQGLGAGLQGQAPQFQAAQQNQQRMNMLQQQQDAQMAEQRQKAVFTDAYGALQLANSGNYDGVIQLGMNRLELLRQFPDADPSDTQRITQLAIAAKNGSEEAQELLTAELGSIVEVGKATGYLSTPERDIREVGDNLVEIPAQGDPSVIYQGGKDGGYKASTDLGKLKQDLDKGLITQAQFDTLSAQALESAPETAADQRARKIQEYQSLYGMSVEEATRAVDSNVMIDDKGNAVLFDPTTQKATMLDIERGESPEAVTAPSGTQVEDLAFDPSKGTGAAAAFFGVWNSTFGQLPMLPIATEPEKAAQELRVLERDAISALGSSGRPPVVEQQRIMSIVPDAMAWTENPEVAKLKMTNFVDLMMNQYVDDIRYSNDPNNPKEVRNESAARANRIESIVRRVMTPEAGDSMMNFVNGTNQAFMDIDNMSEDEFRGLDPSTFTDPAMLDAYVERLNRD